jgi:hypothetical protein
MCGRPITKQRDNCQEQANNRKLIFFYAQWRPTALAQAAPPLLAFWLAGEFGFEFLDFLTQRASGR